jgi:hypothetical protein
MCCAVLCCAVLCCVVLCCAMLCCAARCSQYIPPLKLGLWMLLCREKSHFSNLNIIHLAVHLSGIRLVSLEDILLLLMQYVLMLLILLLLEVHHHYITIASPLHHHCNIGGGFTADTQYGTQIIVIVIVIFVA